MDKFKPMLSATVENVAELKYPLLASPKLDGVRAIVINGVVMSRNLKPIPNKHVQRKFGKDLYNWLDGELIVGDPYAPDVFRATSSGVMSVDGEPDVRFYVFDSVRSPALGYSQRLHDVDKVWMLLGVVPVEQVEVEEPEQVRNYERNQLALGYEGIMLRSASAPYKFGRSTLREHGLMKLKQFVDCEAEIIGFEEQMENTNEAEADNLGHTKRSSHKAGLVGKGTLGAVTVRTLESGVVFSIGTGFDDKLRQQIWDNKHTYFNKIVTCKYFPTGSKDKPRFPVFKGFRDPIDI